MTDFVTPPTGSLYAGIGEWPSSIWLAPSTMFVVGGEYTSPSNVNADNRIIGTFNLSVQQLANRTTHLKSQLDTIIPEIDLKVTRYGVPGGTLVYTPTKNRIFVSGVGGGGGGGGALATDFSGAGGSAGAGELWLPLTVTPGVPISFYCGHGGAGGAVGADGADGTPSTISGLPSQPESVGGVFTLSGGLGGKKGNVIGYCAGGMPVGISGDAGGAGGYGIGAVPGDGGGTCLAPTVKPTIGVAHGYIRGSGGPGGYINEPGKAGGDGYWIIAE